MSRRDKAKRGRAMENIIFREKCPICGKILKRCPGHGKIPSK